ncbi:MAG: GNAT family N-acetyltransferase [Deltaproteobacteria bacterium]|nr:GNAT family N-acetyltransferase [Deltaproteobacteria bacterium]
MNRNFEVSLEDDIGTAEVVELYKANGWSSAEKPEKLMPALKNSDALVTARIFGKLVGIGNAISDGSLVVYYPHMLVHPDHKGRGIGRAMMELLQQKYTSFHQQMLNTDVDAIWDSMESVKKFAEEHPEQAKYYPEDDFFLLEKEETSPLYEIFFEK